MAVSRFLESHNECRGTYPYRNYGDRQVLGPGSARVPLISRHRVMVALEYLCCIYLLRLLLLGPDWLMLQLRTS